MAHAARLNLRMQKELKLLLTDPPYGVSFSSLSDDSSSSSSSLTSIDAHVEGPAGTVYATGVFKVKIQIPERYPFQPPIVTFITPIYHPNIDTGGRICLDILNLPPKGAWQPSLNISTVLTSIGLLLSEPNPDDGLMHEASKEYKHNLAAFDHKARSMTEKYALAREGPSAIGGQGTKPSTAQSEMKVLDASTCENEHFVRHEGFSGSSRKLSLENSGLIMKPDSGKRVHDVPENQMDIGLEEGNKEVDNECNQSRKKLQVARQKCPLKFSDASNSSNPENVDVELPKKDSSVAETENHSMVSSVSLPMLPTAVSHKQQPPKGEGCKLSGDSKIVHLEKRSEQSKKRNIHYVEKHAPMPQQMNSQSSSQNGINLYRNPVDKSGEGLVVIRRKKLGLAGRKPLLGSVGSSGCHFEDNKENQASYQTLPSLQLNKHPTKLPLRPLDHTLGSNNLLQLHSGKPSRAPSKNLSDEMQLCTRVHHEEPAGGFKEQEELLPEPETVIVLDSEDSEDESVSARSKLSLAQICFSRKIKGSN